ncbi:MAG: M1 family aminopeptidase [bacterium]
MRIERAEAQVAGGVVELAWRGGTGGALSLRAEQPLPTGTLELCLQWSGAVGAHPEGLYRVDVDGRPYLFTQFQPVAARRVFPCFDEPRHKATFSLTVHAPAGALVASNSRCLERRADGPVICWRFATTPPIPTYLVAVVVGPFDVVELPEAPVPLRALAPRGRGALARHALDQVPPILACLEAWVGRPFPYEKLDLVAVPEFVAGAMENVGLVTFRERLLLVDPARCAASDLRWTLLVLAHELAHMWFGNLVTMTWWDDLWLSESFATLLEAIVADTISPAFGLGLDLVRDVARVMDHDVLAEARAVRQPVRDGGDIRDAFDGVTYTKGAAVLDMARSWLGDAAFQAAVRRWIGRHAHRNAPTGDLLAELEAASGQPVGAVLGPFLDQVGLPALVVEATSDPRRFRLVVERFGPPLGQQGPPPWQIPARLRVGLPSGEEVIEVLVGATPVEVVTARPPVWLHPNADERGYYRWRLPAGALAALVGPGLAALGDRERVALPGHLWALLELGDVDAAVLLETLLLLARQPQRAVVEAALDTLGRLATRLLPDSHQEAFAARIRAALSPRLAALGLWRRPGEPVEDALVRPAVLQALVQLGDDAGVRSALCARADALLLVEAPDLAEADYVWPLAAASADRRRLGLMLDALATASAPGLRALLVRSLGAVEDPVLLPEILAACLTPLFRPGELPGLLRPMSRHRRGREALHRWVDARFAAITARAGEGILVPLARIAARARTTTERNAWANLFAPPARRSPVVDRTLRLSLEAADRTIRLNARASSALRLALGGGT